VIPGFTDITKKETIYANGVLRQYVQI
jgi:hypothetical protein